MPVTGQRNWFIKFLEFFLIETKRNYDYTPYVTVIPVGSIEFGKGRMRL